MIQQVINLIGEIDGRRQHNGDDGIAPTGAKDAFTKIFFECILHRMFTSKHWMMQ